MQLPSSQPQTYDIDMTSKHVCRQGLMGQSDHNMAGLENNENSSR